MADMDGEDIKTLKRQAAIRAREAEFEEKRKAEEEKKRHQLALLKEEYETQHIKREQDRLAFLKKQAELRAEKAREVERMNALREKKIEKKFAAWKDRANNEIQELLEHHDEEEEKVAQATEDARHRKALKIEAIKLKQKEKEAAWAESQQKRQDANDWAHTQRELNEISKVDQLKSEALEELETFVLNPYPIPLKQVVAGRLRPVPKVTELLASYKDMREDLVDLEEQDIPMRAQLRNQSIFIYARDIQLKAEENRVRPPEPVAGDLGRRANAATKKGGRSPKSTMRNTQTMGRTR